MKKTTLVCGIICGVLFLSGAVMSIILLARPHSSRVNIISGGKIIMTVDLDTVQDSVFTVEYENGKNIIEIKDGRIRVKDADCPDKICVRTGWLTAPSMPIVCLPNRLFVEYADDDGIDAAAR